MVTSVPWQLASSQARADAEPPAEAPNKPGPRPPVTALRRRDGGQGRQGV